MQQNSNPFSERYKTLKDADLLAILNNSQNYQPIAIEAANAELANRNLTAEQVEQLNAEAEIIDRKKALKQQKADAIEQSLLNVVNPPSQATRNIYITLIATTIFYVIALMYGGRLMFTGLFDPAFYNVNFFHATIPYILFPVGILFFAFRKRAGWIIIITICTYEALVRLLILQRDISFKMDHLFSTVVTYRYLFSSAGVTLFSILICVFMCRADIRAEYKVSDRLKVLSITAGVVWLMYDLFKG